MLDVCVVGAGIVGLASAYALQQARPGISLVVLEQEPAPGLHQSSHNSGVIHSGIYYAPGSLKAALCRAGAAATKAFCAENAIPVEACGKLLVATNEAELHRMHRLAARAAENAIACEPLDAAALARREPAITGLGALFVPTTAIVDYRQVCAALLRRIVQAGGALITGARVTRIEELADRVVVHTAAAGRFQARRLVACAGVQADRIAACAGLARDFQIVPFRGEYFRLPAHRKDLVRSLIYPVPDPALPFLGIHLTRTIDGGITVGPNAVLGFARQNYAKFALSPADLRDLAGFPGFWRMLAANLPAGLAELRNSLFKRGYLRMCRKYCPDLTLADLQPQPAGIRAQAVLKDGTLVHDFLLKKTARSLHVCNAPSPAATSALPIGNMIAAEVVG